MKHAWRLKNRTKLSPVKELKYPETKTRLCHIAKRSRMQINREKWYTRDISTLILTKSCKIQAWNPRVQMLACGALTPVTTSENASMAYRYLRYNAQCHEREKNTTWICVVGNPYAISGKIVIIILLANGTLIGGDAQRVCQAEKSLMRPLAGTKRAA